MDDSDIIPDYKYEITATFPTQFPGACNIEERHRIRKGEWVSKLRKADNPLISVPGVCCKLCAMDFPRAKA